MKISWAVFGRYAPYQLANGPAGQDLDSVNENGNFLSQTDIKKGSCEHRHKKKKKEKNTFCTALYVIFFEFLAIIQVHSHRGISSYPLATNSQSKSTSLPFTFLVTTWRTGCTCSRWDPFIWNTLVFSQGVLEGHFSEVGTKDVSPQSPSVACQVQGNSSSAHDFSSGGPKKTCRSEEMNLCHAYYSALAKENTPQADILYAQKLLEAVEVYKIMYKITFFSTSISISKFS